MQRQQRRFQHQADGDEAGGGADRRGIRDRGQARRHVGEIQRAGHHVDQADADQVEGRADGAHHQVLVGRGQPAPGLARGDQHIGGERGDLQEDEDVEGVAGDRDAEQARDAEQPGGVEQMLLVGRDLGRHHGARIGRYHGGDAGDDHQHVGVDQVDLIDDAPGGGPAAELIGPDAVVQHMGEQQGRNRQRHPAHQGGEGPGQPGRLPAAQQRTERCRDQRQGDLQGRQMQRHAHGSSSMA